MPRPRSHALVVCPLWVIGRSSTGDARFHRDPDSESLGRFGERESGLVVARPRDRLSRTSCKTAAGETFPERPPARHGATVTSPRVASSACCVAVACARRRAGSKPGRRHLREAALDARSVRARTVVAPGCWVLLQRDERRSARFSVGCCLCLEGMFPGVAQTSSFDALSTPPAPGRELNPAVTSSRGRSSTPRQ